MILATVPPYEMVCPVEAGLSEEYKNIKALMDNIRFKSREPLSFSWRESVRDDIERSCRTHSKTGWDGYDAEPVSLESARGALRIINALPDHINPPNVVPEPDGVIALEWNDGSQKTLALSLSGNLLTYAGVFGGTCKKYGEEPFFSALPSTIIGILSEYFPKV